MYAKVKYVICAVGILIRSQVFAFHGYITTDTTWLDTVYVDGDVIVQENVVLTVDPGTHILFSPDTSVWEIVGISNRCDLMVKGKLKLLTSASDSMFFNTYPDSGGWGSIMLMPGVNDTIEYAKITHATRGIWCQMCSPLIRNCIIFNSAHSDTSIGIYCRDSSPQIIGNTISNICGRNGASGLPTGSAYGIYCLNSSALISNNIIESCIGGDGLVEYNWGQLGCGIYGKKSTLIVVNNIIEGCIGGDGHSDHPFVPVGGGDGIGIYCESCTTGISDNTVYNCEGGYPCGYPCGGSYGIGVYFIWSYSLPSGISRNGIYECVGIPGDYPGKSARIYCKFSNPIILENCIHDCGWHGGVVYTYAVGVYCESASPHLFKNRIYNHYHPVGEHILHCNIFMEGNSNPIIGGAPDCQNNIYNSKPNYNIVNLTHNDIIVTYNWWGDTITDTIAEYIYDHEDNSNYGYIIYDPWAPDSFIPTVEEVEVETSHLEVFLQNYPNPFIYSTFIRYSIPEAGRVSLKIYDNCGCLVKNLIDDEQKAGLHIVQWDKVSNNGRKVVSGIHFYILETNGIRTIKKMVVLEI